MKPDCYKCIYMGTLPGDVHSCCKHPAIKADSNSFGAMVELLSGKFDDAIAKLEIRGNQHGMQMGWFIWPANFDPVWLENCNGFKEKEKTRGKNGIKS